MNLTTHQKQFILDRFFKKLDVTNWKQIANELIETGKCVVEGKDRIWKEGIGNFIEVIPNEEVFDVMIYKFDTLRFIESEYFKDELDLYLNIAELELRQEQIRLAYLTRLRKNEAVQR